MTMTMPVTQPPSSRGQLRILIVEDHMLFAESLELVLSVEGYDVRRVAGPGQLRVARARCCRPWSGSGRGSCCSTSTWAASATASGSSRRSRGPASTSWS